MMPNRTRSVALLLACALLFCSRPSAQNATAPSRLAPGQELSSPPSAQYQQVQRRLSQGWNTWDVDSMTTHVLLPDGLAIEIGFEHNATVSGDEFLGRTSVGQGIVVPGPHAWDGRYTDLRVAWRGNIWRVQSAQVPGRNLVLLVTPLHESSPSALPSTVVFTVGYLWNHPGTVLLRGESIEARSDSGVIPIYCTCGPPPSGADLAGAPAIDPYFAADLTRPIGVSTGQQRSLHEIQGLIAQAEDTWRTSLAIAAGNAQIVDAIETTLGWDTIYEPSHERVISPVSRDWSKSWGGYVLFDWDTFFAATMASLGDRDLAYADALETLREETPEGFVPNYARAGGWKSCDRSEPPVGSITVLGLYRKFHDPWFLVDAFDPLLRWNRWWDQHRQIQGYLTWGSDGDNQPVNPEDAWRGTRAGAILESGLDNSPMYDSAAYDPKTHLLEFADVGLMSLYIADCDALVQMAHELGRSAEERELAERATRYRAKLATLWDPQRGIFLNRDLHTGRFNQRLSPTNFYPMLAHAATAEQARAMIERHLLNPKEFWGEWVIPSIARNDPAFHDQNYWRGRIWGPMNYLVYLGLRNYDDPAVRRQFAQKSYDLFLGEWRDKGHVHENYNAIGGTGDDVRNSDRFYHWGALLGFIQFLEQTEPAP